MGGIETPIGRAARIPISGVGGAFLRVDRGSALYVTDAPRRGARTDALIRAYDEAGFGAAEDRGLLRITPRKQWIHALTEALGRGEDADEQSKLLARLISRDISDAEHFIWIEAVKCVESGAASSSLERKIRETAAFCLRQGRGGGALFHAYILIKAQR